jgi:hypothetical protein
MRVIANILFALIAMIILTVLLSSCSANYYLKRSQQLERKAVMLGAIIKHDTVYKERVIIMTEKSIDTVVRHVNFRDTVTVTKNRIVTKVKIDTIHHTVFVDTKCPADTIKIKVPITIVKHIETSGDVPWWIWAIVSALVFLIIILIVRK